MSTFESYYHLQCIHSNYMVLARKFTYYIIIIHETTAYIGIFNGHNHKNENNDGAEKNIYNA